MATENTTTKIVSKSDLREYLGIKHTKLKYLLNVKYYDELVELGYEKKRSILPPVVTRRFLEIWGTKIKDDEI
ncbi:hypothetical protein [Brumimicrobium mesophilum]|uniref:hypothetical protein n=1 Tax=Brumimicrobium mesophilum TaxID=392717 RepID=UPI000D142D45|nr:hypothetical protein [Brumimicrobium mesophilum]